MDSQQQQIVEKLQAANNILVTVSSNPSVDQLSAAIGLTLLLNKLDKHATAVFSGNIPSTIEFLKPEDTLEKNTDSLRDFIIALDKSKADKLRYKVEDKVVKIFITPYRTSLSSDDLEFSQGDFNVDVVVALGVHEQADLDQAITAHGRILHDAVVTCISNTSSGELGSINWVDSSASSLSELITELSKSFDKQLLDGQIATALLTGIVAETDRFRNDKTTAATMNASADLMSAGANQQLVAEELDHEIQLRAPNKPDEPGQKGDNGGSNPPPEEPKPDDGMLEITHDNDKNPDETAPDTDMPELPAPVDNENDLPEVTDVKITGDSAANIDAEGTAATDLAHDQGDPGRTLITEPPTMGGTLTANSQPDNGDMTSMDLPSNEPSMPLLDHENHVDDPSAPANNPPENHDGPALSSPPNSPAPSISPTPPDQPNPPVAPTPQMLQPAGPQPPPNPTFTEVEKPQPPMPSTPPQPPAPPAFAPPPAPMPPPLPPQPSLPPAPIEPPKPPVQHETLTELEESVDSPHIDSLTPSQVADEEVEKARQEVLRAINEQPDANLPPVDALNAQPLDLRKDSDASPAASGGFTPPASLSQPHVTVEPLPPNAPDLPPFSNSPADQPMDMPIPSGLNVPPAPSTPPTNSPATSSTAPPPVPPPMTPRPWSNN